ncbi:MAG: hypothetical protein R2701_05800 [Acidimicrobiales bacterium]
MATIRASCSDCGDVELTSADVTVRVCSADSTGSYSFSCPRCSRIVVKSAEPRIVELLVTSGVRLVTWHLPEELAEVHEATRSITTTSSTSTTCSSATTGSTRCGG